MMTQFAVFATCLHTEQDGNNTLQDELVMRLCVYSSAFYCVCHMKIILEKRFKYTVLYVK